MAYIPKSNITNAIPIGTIVAIHPSMDFASIIDDNVWKFCDGSLSQTVTYPDKTTYGGGTGNFDLPDLTDDRFLMGVSGTTPAPSTILTNYLPDHKHSTNANDLCLADITYTGGSGSVVITHGHADTLRLNNGSFSGRTSCIPAHTHDMGHLQGCCGFAASNRYLLIDGSASNYAFALPTGGHNHNVTGSVSTTLAGGVSTHTGTCSFSNIGGNINCNCITGTIGEGTTDVHAGTIDNRPKYFTVRYYMRIK